MFSRRLLEYFEQARWAGEAEDATGRARVENPVCGDVLELSARVGEGRLLELRYRCRGCVAAMGCAAALADRLQAASVAELAAFGREELRAAVDGVPEASEHALTLALDARDQLLDQLGRSGRGDGGGRNGRA